MFSCACVSVSSFSYFSLFIDGWVCRHDTYTKSMGVRFESNRRVFDGHLTFLLFLPWYFFSLSVFLWRVCTRLPIACCLFIFFLSLLSTRIISVHGRCKIFFKSPGTRQEVLYTVISYTRASTAEAQHGKAKETKTNMWRW